MLKLPGVFAALLAFAALSTAAQAETYVIDRAHIEASGARTVADAIRDVPGVSLFRYGGLGARVLAGLRGSQSQAVLILLDGVRISPATAIDVDLGTFSTVGLARIEVVEGADAVRYGSGAIAGVINIITGIARGTAATIATGSYGETEGRLSIGGPQLGFAYEVHTANNTYGYPAFNTFRAGTKSYDWASLGAARLTYNAALAPQWRLRAAFGIDDAHVAQSSNRLDKTAHADAQVDVTRETAHSALTFALSGSRERFTEAYAGFGPDDSPLYFGRVQFAARHTVIAAHAQIESGFEITRESEATGALFGASASQQAIYTKYTRTFARGSAYAGVRAESARPHDSLLAPAAGASLSLGRLELAANMGGSYQLPSISDWASVWDTARTARIPPQRFRNADITLGAPTALGGISFAWFSSIATAPRQIGTTSPLAVASQPELAGLTLNASTKPFHGITAGLGITNVYRAVDLARRLSRLRAGTDPASRLTFEPLFEGELTLSRPLGTSHFGFGMSAHVRGPYAGTTPLRSTDRSGATVVDGYVRLRIAPRGVATIRLRNAGNEVYTPIFADPVPRRTIEFELSNR